MTKFNEITSETKKNICDDYTSNTQIKYIFEKYKINQYILYKILKEYDVKFDKRKSNYDRTFTIITDDVKNSICNDYIKGLRWTDLQSKYKLSKTNIEKVIKRNKVYISKQQSVENKMSKIISLYDTGLSPEKISKQLHMGSTAVTSFLRNSGITLRNPAEYNKKYSCDETYFDNIDCFDKAQIIGMLTADGYIEKTKHTINLNLQEQDLDYLEWVNRKFNSNYPIVLFRKKENSFVSKQGKIYNVKNHYKFSICHPHLHSTVQKHNIVHRKSYANLGLPSTIPSDLYKAFALGIMEGDGSIGIYTDKRLNKNSKYGVCSFLVQEKMAYDLAKIIEEQLGIVCKLRKKNEKLYTISFYSADNLIKLYHWFYDDANFVMKRKHDKFVEIMNLLSNKGHQIGELRIFQ
jgi:hypothetical protein